MDPDVKQLLQGLFKANRATEREAFSMASVAQYVEQGNTMQRNTRRQEAQVDAILKAKYAACGQPELYEPPNEGEGDGMATLINCNFYGDESVDNITKSIQQIATDQKKTDDEDTEPIDETPALSPPANGSRLTSRLGKAAILGASLVGAGGIGAIATQWLSKPTTVIEAGDSSEYGVRAIPYEPAGETTLGD